MKINLFFIKVIEEISHMVLPLIIQNMVECGYMFERDGINTENDHPNTNGQKIWGDYLKEQQISRNII